MPDDELIADQIRYYRERASEYDSTWRVPEDPLGDQVRQLVHALDAFQPAGRVLEIACGTGEWTKRLVRYAADLTAIDSSPEMIELCKRKVSSRAVRFEVADVFKWTPGEPFDVVFFGFWLSHVPSSRFEEFWDTVRRALAPGGRVFFVDETEVARHHEEIAGDEVVVRRLVDGTVHRAVKIFWKPAELQARLEELGWRARVGSTGAFLWCEASPRSVAT